VIDRPRFHGYLDVRELTLDPLDRPATAPAGTLPIATLVRAHHAYIWRLCRRLGLGESDADDAVQQVFIIASGRVSDILPGRERAFLYGVALNVIAKWRHARARSREDAEVDLDGFESELSSLDDLSDQHRARRVLDALLDTLPLELRVVFVLYEIEEQTVAEIAEALGIPLGTASSRLRRAREEFSTRLARLAARRRFEGETP